MNRCFIALTAMFTTLAALTPAAQDTPDIVWSTNAHTRSVLAVAFSSDGALLASGSLDRTTRVWQVSDRSLVQSFRMEGWATAVAFAPDQSLLGVGDDFGNLGIWRMSDGMKVIGGAGAENNGCYAVTFSPDSQLFAPAAKESGLRYILQAPSFRTSPPFTYPEGRSSFDVRFSPDGTLLASGNSDNTASLFGMSAGALLRDLSGHSQPVTSVDFSPDGRLLATAAADGDARLWRVPDGTLVRTIPGGGSSEISLGSRALGRARFSADGNSLLTLSNGAVRFWRVADGKLLLTYPDLEAFSLAVSPDRKHFAYGTGSQYGTNAALVLARMPVILDNPKAQTNHLNFDWQGGSGLYQVQQTTSVTSAVWANLGPPTAATSLTMPMTNAATFFRVQSLTNAP